MTAEAKMRTLAQQDATLQSFFFTDSVRWFDRQLQPNYLKIGASCARVLRVSTIPMYTHETNTRQSKSNLSYIRFQIDVLDYEAERARAAAAAITDWLATVDFTSNAQFSSPVTSPTRHPNQLINQRAGMEYKIQPPAYVEMLDIRILNLEE